MKILKIFKNKDGQIMILVPFIVMLGMLFSMLFVDIGLAYKYKSHGQNITDMACRGGAYYGAVTGNYTPRRAQSVNGKGVALVELNKVNANNAAMAVILDNSYYYVKPNVVDLKIDSIAYNGISNEILTQNPDATATYWDKTVAHSDTNTGSKATVGAWVTIPLKEFKQELSNIETTAYTTRDVLYNTGNFSVYMESEYHGLMGAMFSNNVVDINYSNYTASFTSGSYSKK